MERKAASGYPQELLDLFHEYQHGDISRRTFLDRAAKFAIGGLTVAAIFESLRPNYAWEQQVQPDDKRIKVGYEVVQSTAGTVLSKAIWPARQKMGSNRSYSSFTKIAALILTSKMPRAGWRSPTS